MRLSIPMRQNDFPETLDLRSERIVVSRAAALHDRTSNADFRGGISKVVSVGFVAMRGGGKGKWVQEA